MVPKLLEDFKRKNLKKDWHFEKRRMFLHEETKKFARTFRTEFATLIISAFGLTVALLWNDALKSFINMVFPAEDPNNTMFKVYVSVVVTVLAITTTYLLSKLKSEK